MEKKLEEIITRLLHEILTGGVYSKEKRRTAKKGSTLLYIIMKNNKTFLFCFMLTSAFKTTSGYTFI